MLMRDNAGLVERTHQEVRNDSVKRFVVCLGGSFPHHRRGPEFHTGPGSGSEPGLMSDVTFFTCGSPRSVN